MGFEEAVNRGGKVRTITGPNRRYGVNKDEYMRKVTYEDEVTYSDIRKRKTRRISKQRRQREFDIGLRRER